MIYGSISIVLWYGGKLVHENSKDKNTGVTPGILTGQHIAQTDLHMVRNTLKGLSDICVKCRFRSAHAG